MSSKHIIAYFPNLGNSNVNNQNIAVGMIPWNKITLIQHASFYINSDWNIASTDDWADFQKPYDHSNHGLKGHIGEYKYYKSIYPDKKLLLSIGGESKISNFSQMASNAQNRATFITSCINFLTEYPFFDGLDIAWKYPQSADKTNFTLLLKEIRMSLNQNNMANKMLTIAVPADNKNIANQDISNYKDQVDLINIMDYDYDNSLKNITTHNSPLYSNPLNLDIDNTYLNIDYSVNQYLNAGVSSTKLSIGTPFYSRGWSNVDFSTGINNGLYSITSGSPIGTWDNLSSPSGQNPWFQLKALETDSNWEKHYDNVAKAPYLINKIQKYFYTYEDENSLTEKCNYINSKNLAGISIWDINGDDLNNNAPMTSIIWNNIILNESDSNINLKQLQNITIESTTQPPTITAAKSFNKSAVSLNDQILVTITISNTSTSAISNLILLDSIPVNATLVNNSLVVNGTSVSGSTLPTTPITIANLSAGSSAIVSYSMYFYSLPAINPVNAVFYLYYNYLDSTSITQTNKIIGTFNSITIAKDPISRAQLFTSTSAAISGNKVLYTLILKNSGSSTATNVVLKDIIPQGLSYVTNSLTVNNIPVSGNLNAGVPISSISPNTEIIVNFQLTVN